MPQQSPQHARPPGRATGDGESHCLISPQPSGTSVTDTAGFSNGSLEAKFDLLLKFQQKILKALVHSPAHDGIEQLGSSLLEVVDNKHAALLTDLGELLDSKFEHYLNATPAVEQLASSLQSIECQVSKLGGDLQNAHRDDCTPGAASKESAAGDVAALVDKAIERQGDVFRDQIFKVGESILAQLEDAKLAYQEAAHTQRLDLELFVKKLGSVLAPTPAAAVPTTARSNTCSCSCTSTCVSSSLSGLVGNLEDVMLKTLTDGAHLVGPVINNMDRHLEAFVDNFEAKMEHFALRYFCSDTSEASLANAQLVGRRPSPTPADHDSPTCQGKVVGECTTAARLSSDQMLACSRSDEGIHSSCEAHIVGIFLSTLEDRLHAFH